MSELNKAITTVLRNVNMNHFDDWTITTCDYCGEHERKCYRMDDLPLNQYDEPQYYCSREDCKHLRYFNGE